MRTNIATDRIGAHGAPYIVILRKYLTLKNTDYSMFTRRNISVADRAYLPKFMGSIFLAVYTAPAAYQFRNRFGG
ncbi:hypothetical protein ACFOFO_11485 [Undibacterium arcticum]|uniref:Uncharacterized protein n=1 Tax=Undibacterium arcticum TaxID=1762892 RepID=A0ABV7F0L2_9BURK